jgi:hypothetical protein
MFLPAIPLWLPKNTLYFYVASYHPSLSLSLYLWLPNISLNLCQWLPNISFYLSTCGSQYIFMCISSCGSLTSLFLGPPPVMPSSAYSLWFPSWSPSPPPPWLAGVSLVLSLDGFLSFRILILHLIASARWVLDIHNRELGFWPLSSAQCKAHHREYMDLIFWSLTSAKYRIHHREYRDLVFWSLSSPNIGYITGNTGIWCSGHCHLTNIGDITGNKRIWYYHHRHLPNKDITGNK